MARDSAASLSLLIVAVGAWYVLSPAFMAPVSGLRGAHQEPVQVQP